MTRPLRTYSVAPSLPPELECLNEIAQNLLWTWDHEMLERLRDEATHNIPSKCSEYCSSPGHIANERERSHFDDIWDDSGKIKKLHLEQSLACNLTCISCSSSF